MNYSGSSAEAGGDDAMRRAFEQFMMQGKSNKNNSTTTNIEELQEKEESKKKQEINQIQIEINKSEKKYWSIYHRFCNILQNHWIDIDDQTLQVVHSISGIRHRLPLQMKQSKKYEESKINTQNDSLKFQGYNQTLISSSSSLLHDSKQRDLTWLLQREDIELALSYDLIQHEKMMEGLRSLLSNLAETHESLSRTLDEIMKFHLQQQEVLINYDKHYSSLSWTSYQKTSELVGVLNDLFQMLSMELYRKQMLTNSILDSADDRILLSDQEDWFGSHVGNDPNDASPKKIIKYCLDCWSRPCDQSCIDTTLLEYALSLHEK